MFAVIESEYAIEAERYKWGKTPYDSIGYLGGLGVVPNNLVYTYDFETNSWNQFIKLDTLFIENYSCTTHFTKNGNR